MDNKRVDALNQSRNIRLLALKEIFEEDISFLKTATNNKAHCYGDKLQVISTTNI